LKLDTALKIIVELKLLDVLSVEKKDTRYSNNIFINWNFVKNFINFFLVIVLKIKQDERLKNIIQHTFIQN